MPLPRLVADVFGAVTISLVLILVILSLLCINHAVYFRSQVQRQSHLQLGYFNGPWYTRIAFVLVAIFWGFGEIIRLRLLKGERRLSISPAWQENICKIYIVWNIGFAESALLLFFVFFLQASLQRKESGALGHRWNRRIIIGVFWLCLIPFLVQLILVLVGSKFIVAEGKNHEKLVKYFTTISSLTENNSVTCLYPLLNTVFLGLFDIILIIYVSYLGFHMLTVVINKGLQRRIYILILSVVCCLPVRVGLLGFSVLADPGVFAHEVLVFLAFLVLLVCLLLCICMLVYYPIADSLALRALRHSEVELTPFDDYFDGASSLIVNQSHLETGRNSDASTKRGSISFRTMIRDDLQLPNSDGYEEVSFSPSPGTFHISSSPGSPFLQGRPLVPLRGVPEY